MRAVSLSNPTVISLLNRHFVPVFVSNEDYRGSGSAPPEERAELQRIHREGHAAKLSVGTVHAYVLAPDGRLLDSLHTVQAAKPELLIGLLEKTVSALRTPAAAAPVVEPCPPPVPEAAPGVLRLHLTARYLERRGDDYVLVRNAGGNWSALPSEDWILLRREEAAMLLPTTPARIGLSWEIDPKLASRLLTHFYPPTENSDISKNRIDEQVLRATIVSVEGSRARARITGSLTMKHPFYHKDDDKFVTAGIVGFLEFEPRNKRIVSLQIVTDQADYGGRVGSRLPYGVALRLVPG